MTLGRLATLVAELPAWAVNALTLDELDIMPPGGPPPKFEALGSTKQILDVFDRNTKRSEEHTSELQSRLHLVCRLLLEKKKIISKEASFNNTAQTREPTAYRAALSRRANAWC